LQNNYVKKNQVDAQLILSMLRQPLHVSGVKSSIIRIGLDWVPIQPGQQTVI